MKVPVGAIVVIDLWNTTRGNGMVRHEADTLNLVRAESDFHLDKGQRAIVIKSTDNFVKVIPKDDFSAILSPKTLVPDIDALARRIRAMLLDSASETGGILPFASVVDTFDRSSAKGLVTADHLRKASHTRDKLFEETQYNNEVFLTINVAEMVNDQAAVMDQVKQRSGNISEGEMKLNLGWSEIRLRRVLDYLVSIGTLRCIPSYKDGTRYCLPGD
nr:hypothetical protein [Candidatus Sigynarchaeota archaeon]